MTASGFVAGTLVHTDKGLVPIEQLKVGDMVLSKHESGQGEQAYKRVIKTFKSAEKLPIVRVSFRWEKDDADKGGYMHIFCTYNHPFWVAFDGWKLASDLEDYEALLDINEKMLLLEDIACPLRETKIPELAVCASSTEWEQHDGFSMLIDFSRGKPVLIGGGNIEFQGLSSGRHWHPDEEIHYLPTIDKNPDVDFYFNQAMGDDWRRVDDERLHNAYRAYVYNIEVKDFHTYFISKAGILTHDSANIAP